MGLRFRKSKSFGPLKINVSKSGVGYSVGGKGFRVTKRADGKTQTTASIPGSGISYTSVSGEENKKMAKNKSSKNAGCLVWIIVLIAVMMSCSALTGGDDKTPQDTPVQAAVAASASSEEEQEPAASASSSAQEQPDASTDDGQSSASGSASSEETDQDLGSSASTSAQDEPEQQPSPETKPEPETPPAAAPVQETPASEPAAAQPQEMTVIGNRNTKKYHKPSCSSVGEMSDKNKVTFSSPEKAEASGYVACKRCF